MGSKIAYITTAIDYVNGAPHLGHAYEKITTDVIARWMRLQGRQVRFLTGTDEHGIKIQKAAQKAGLPTQQYVDSLIPAFVDAWAALDISYDRFIRTTDADHIAAVHKLLHAIRDNGYLQEKKYEGWYCEGCEAFKADKDLLDERCPVHPNLAPTWLEEDNLFFKLSEFGQPLLDLYESNPQWLEPESRRNEILSMLREGITDLSISRSKDAVAWGIDIPFRPDSVMYVWFDALINYLTGAGYGSDPELFAACWPADLHVLGKDVTRFHCIIWPAMLMAAGIELPAKVFAHGWVLVKGGKLSKSADVDEAEQRDMSPAGIAGVYGADAVRWFLTREVTFGRDGEFSWERFEALYDAHLANGLGNLLSRSIGMTSKYFGGVPAPGSDPLLRDVVEAAVAEASAAYDELRLHDAAAAAWRIVTTCNEQVQSRQPWVMAKDEARQEELATFLYSLQESVRIVAVLLSPILVSKSRECLRALKAEDCLERGTDALAWGGLAGNTPLDKPTPLFPRLDQLQA